MHTTTAPVRCPCLQKIFPDFPCIPSKSEFFCAGVTDRSVLLNIYISHAPADRRYVLQLVEWLKPMQEKYFFRIWYDHPEPPPVVPFPWNVLFFWYSPHRHRLPYHRDLLQEAEQAHIYLFFVSQKSIHTHWIEQEEVPRAVERYQQHGRNYVRIFPVLLSASQWKQESRLAAFPTLGPPGRTINQVQPSEDAWLSLIEQLRPVIVELRQNLMEEHKRLGLPLASFNSPPPPWSDTPKQVIPLPNWIGWVIMAVIFWSLFNWFSNQCTPQYKPYWPKRNPPQEEFRRENPVLPTPREELPLRPVDSVTTGKSAPVDDDF